MLRDQLRSGAGSLGVLFPFSVKLGGGGKTPLYRDYIYIYRYNYMIQHLSNLSNKTSLKLGQQNIWRLETTTLCPYLITLLCPLVNKNSRLERKLFARKTTLWMINFHVWWVERCNGISHQPRVSLSVCLWTRATAAETKGGNLSFVGASSSAARWDLLNGWDAFPTSHFSGDELLNFRGN